MFDRFNRRIHYLRISVTDRCNLRCYYCSSAGELPRLKHSDLLSFEEIEELVITAVKLGFDKIRLTGGEPLIRHGIEKLVAIIAKIQGIKDLSLTTNGTLLKEFAPLLAQAGLKRINISLDTLDAQQYEENTRGGNLNDVLEGIKAAQKVGFNPIKLNCVVAKNSQEPDAVAIKEFAKNEGLEARFIMRMNPEKGEFAPVEGGEGGICKICNRLRLTCDGKILPCLFSDLAFNVRELGAETAIRQAIEAKPELGVMSHNHFREVGG